MCTCLPEVALKKPGHHNHRGDCDRQRWLVGDPNLPYEVPTGYVAKMIGDARSTGRRDLKDISVTGNVQWQEI